MPKKPKHYKPATSKSKKFTFNKSGREKGYDSNWEKYRRRFLYHNPKCYICTNRATTVDHIKAHKGDSELFTSTVNHLPCCKQCHDYMTGKFDRHATPLLDEKIKWIDKQRTFYNNTVRVKVLPYYSKK